MNFVLAIARNSGALNARAVDYCKDKGVDYRLVDFASTEGFAEAARCDAIFWHVLKEELFADRILTALEFAGMPVFPNIATRWSAENKMSQYLNFPVAGIPHPETKVFFDEAEAMAWAEQAKLPQVWKLSTGDGSLNVALLETREELRQYIRKSFGPGFWNYRRRHVLKMRIGQWRKGQVPFLRVLTALYRFLVLPKSARALGKQQGYFIAQSFVANNPGDVRVIVIGDKAFGISRRNREGDFRASASGLIDPNPALVDREFVELAFDVNDKLKSQCIAYDMVRGADGKPLILEIVYDFTPAGYDNCPGYWTRDLSWVEGSFNPYGWIIEGLSSAASARLGSK
jgi:glutathione synthase/RimK-type ligase-like ATP-grasp enzyme